MIFDNIMINKNVWSKFTSAFKKNKIANGYIFFGKDGVGKEGHAIEFSALLNCKRPLDNNFACGNCRSCISIKTFQHEDTHLIHPLPIAKSSKSSEVLITSTTINELRNNYEEKTRNPYHKIKISNANTISINSIRGIKKKLFLSRSDGNWSVVIIFDAEKLCVPKTEPANSLLKILEEPPDRTSFILITSKINQLLPTIKSRCQNIFFPDLDKAMLNEYILKHHKDISIDDSVTELSNGSIYHLSQILKDGTNKKIKELVDNFFSDDLNNIEKILSYFDKEKRKNKENINLYLNYLCIIAKDMYILSLNNMTSSIQFSFLLNHYQPILNQFPDSDWNKIIFFINECIQDLRKNLNMSLSIYNMLINVRYCLKGNLIDKFKSTLTEN